MRSRTELSRFEHARVHLSTNRSLASYCSVIFRYDEESARGLGELEVPRQSPVSDGWRGGDGGCAQGNSYRRSKTTRDLTSGRSDTPRFPQPSLRFHEDDGSWLVVTPPNVYVTYAKSIGHTYSGYTVCSIYICVLSH